MIEMTTWHNPTMHPVKLSFHRGPGYRRDEYEIAPDERQNIPSEYDDAIRQVNPSSMVVIGGLAPQLVKIGEKVRPVVHEALTERPVDRLVVEANTKSQALITAAELEAQQIREHAEAEAARILADAKAAAESKPKR